MSNLLCIDFDTFFPNPMETGSYGDPTWQLYDWGHAETNVFVNMVWDTRAAGFILNDLPLPQVIVPEHWWDRFTISEDAHLFVADSNAYAGLVRAPDNGPFEHVVLFDAHHDLYKIETQDEYHDWVKVGSFSCEDWMFQHHEMDARLHWRWPQWLTNGADRATQVPEWVNLDARVDGWLDDTVLDLEYDTVFVCRSGAWVPPWCDQDFQEFYRSAPVAEIEQLDDVDLVRSDKWRTTMQSEVNAIRAMTAQAKEDQS